MFAQISRRAFVARVTAVAGGLSGGLLVRGTFAAPGRLPVFHLVACDSCATCRACRLHADNKLFASGKAADAHRAHRGCNCGIAAAGTLPRGPWTALFGPAKQPHHLIVDRRHAEVARLIGQANPVLPSVALAHRC